MPGEFDLIERIRARALVRADVILGIGDDAALLAPPPGMQLAVATDTLNEGVHFPAETSAYDIGWKALAVNLSDLAAMGAMPAWCSLSLSMPQADGAWLDSFIDGFSALAAMHDVALIGGDTTRGPLSICVSVIGFVEPGRAMRRDAAKVGDDVWVSGTLGDAAAALAQWRSGEVMLDDLRARLDRPTPRVALGRALVGIATSCVDVSDGLLADIGHVCEASNVGAQIELNDLPASAQLIGLPAGHDETRHRWQATGGDDYELCFTAPTSLRLRVGEVASQTDVALTRVGTIDASRRVLAVIRGREWLPSHSGHEHFIT